MNTFEKYLRILLKIFAPIIGLALGAWLLWRGAVFFFPFVIGWVIAMIVNPIVRYLEQKFKLARKAGSLILVIGVLALILLGGYALFSRIGLEVFRFAQDAPEILEAARIQVESAISLFSGLERFVDPGTWQKVLDYVGILEDSISGFVGELGQVMVEATGNFAKKIPNAFFYTIITVISSYFFIADIDKLTAALKRAVPQSVAYYAGVVKENIKRAIGGYLSAQLKLMVLVAVILTVGLSVLRVSYSGFWAVLIALLDFLPVFGTGTVLIPWALIQFLNREFSMAVGLLVLYLVSQLVRQLLQPKIVGDSVGLSPLLTLFLIYIGFRLNGVIGMIVAMPVGLLLLEGYKAGVFDGVMDGVRELATEIQNFMGKE